MDRSFYHQLAASSLRGDILDRPTCQRILEDSSLELLPLLDAAFQVRKTHMGHEVRIHILNNTQNGHCPEDCHYCVQAKTSTSDIEEYPLKSQAEILAEAKKAYESGAFRYCLVSAGRGPSAKRVDLLADTVRLIKKNYPIQVCISAGLMGEEAAQILKEAGLDRLNHNLNTSERFYPSICTTHTYADRKNTLLAAKKANLEICSGIIVGMGETHQDVIDVAMELNRLQSPSIPVNFFIPVDGNTLSDVADLTPQYCLRVLCLFRFLNPKSELRVSAGREGHLRSMEVLSLYPANSLFLDGYLNVKGQSPRKTLQMIKDAGFSIKSEKDLEDVLKQHPEPSAYQVDGHSEIIKTWKELRPLKTTTE